MLACSRKTKKSTTEFNLRKKKAQGKQKAQGLTMSIITRVK